MGFLPETRSDPPGVALGEPAAEAAERDELARRLATEMAQRWREGRPLAEEFLARHPALRDDARARAEWGWSPSFDHLAIVDDFLAELRDHPERYSS